MPTESLEATDALSARSATHPRVALKDIEDAIGTVHYLNLGDALALNGQPTVAPHYLMTLCVVTLKNGWVQLGKSAPAHPENYDEEKGRTFAYEDAVRGLWPLMGFALRDRIHETMEQPAA